MTVVGGIDGYGPLSSDPTSLCSARETEKTKRKGPGFILEKVRFVIVYLTWRRAVFLLADFIVWRGHLL